MEKHAVYKISVIVDMREFKVVGSGSQAVTGFNSSR